MFTALRWRFFVPFSLVNSNCWFAGKTRNTNGRCYGDIMPLWQGWQEPRMIKKKLFSDPPSTGQRNTGTQIEPKNTVFTRISAAFGTKKVNKRRPE